MLARRFVLIPLLELDMDLAVPSGERLADALAQLPVEEGVRRAGPAAGRQRSPSMSRSSTAVISARAVARSSARAT